MLGRRMIFAPACRTLLPAFLAGSVISGAGGCGSSPQSGDSLTTSKPVQYCVPSGGGAVSVPVGETSVELEFPASAAGQKITLTPSTAAHIGYPSGDLEGVIKLEPDGLTFDEPVIVRPKSGELLVLNVPSSPGPSEPEILPLTDNGSGLALSHFSSIAILRLSRLSGWAQGSGTCDNSAKSVVFNAPLATYCHEVAVSCCTTSASLTCHLRDRQLRLSLRRLLQGGATHCANVTDVDASAPAVDASAPAVDASAPAVDASATDVDASAPAVDAGAPGPDASVPARDASVPTPDASTGNHCPGSGGPTMVDVGPFCIDSTEVTNAHYAAFLTAKAGDVSGQIAACQENLDYAPATADWVATELTMKPNHPVGWVDWCDAYAFCSWAGKRLCGNINGGPNAATDFTNPSLSQWHYACTANGTRTYPYGNTFELMTCNTRGSDGSGDFYGTTGNVLGRLAVPARASCVGGFAGIFDMSGNVHEWTDECGSAETFSTVCKTRGGSSHGNWFNALCEHNTGSQRRYTYEHIGFRCCSI